MSKKFMFQFMLALTVVVAAVLWILQVCNVIAWFSASAAIALISGVSGLMFIFKGLFGRTNASALKKLNIYFGAGLLIVALFMLVNIFAIKNELVLPIIAIIVTVALLIGVIATGGKSSDTGDNQKAGYKNYYQRKAEEEKKNKED